jgi:uncharacterized protein (DUF1800 family)
MTLTPVLQLRGLVRTMLMAGVAIAAGVAWAAPAEVPLGAERAQLLLTRAGFAPTADEIAGVAPLTQVQAVDRMLSQTRRVAVTPLPGWINEPMVPPRVYRQMSDEEKLQERQKQVRQGLELRGWWLREMTVTPSPLTERMTLFWHNHFVSAQPKVRWTPMMARQNALLREHALGDFGRLLHAVAKDPAMLVYLDAASNRRGNANENLAREIMELFTLGQGQYAEADIKEAARALTGWSIDPDTGHYLFRPGLHDGGEKTIFGRRGAFDGDQFLDLLLAQPATAEFITTKLWREFVSSTPDAARVRAIAARWRASGYGMPVVLRELLLQPELVTRTEDNALVKSPVELVVGLVRQTGAELAQPVGAAVAVAAMGQNLFSPPNVRGWPGGEAWINTQTLLARKQFIDRALASSGAATMTMTMNSMAPPAAEAGVNADAEMAARIRRRLELAQVAAIRFDSQQFLKSAGGLHPERVVSKEQVAALSDRLLVLDPVSPPAPGVLGLDALRALLLDPAYQLK